ncbi:predicted protein [Naegleria gruberi]|uniref:Predicted protein n=1 Tax=Naegleria gruberi TaxID=5762 RepID=D2W015_NAEGR|nr:uncharacterized protein NAEGRDRAFT_74695 [Naegleria gruberi]EFC37624.1 predicted protein [Naegleria gruberi]|eukprot:XP_002670368.1 predicted protein [Naegleria gruberi strain NEG-M]
MTRVSPYIVDHQQEQPNAEKNDDGGVGAAQLFSDTADNASSLMSSSEYSTTHKSVSFFTSIKFCLILAKFMVVLLSVSTLSIIWISSFAPTVSELSSKVRDSEINVIIKNTVNTLSEIAHVGKIMRQQVLSYGYGISDYSKVEVSMYGNYKTSQELYGGVTIASYIGDPYNNCFGTMTWTSTASGAATFNITPTDFQIFYCASMSDNERCIRDSTPNEVLGFYDMKILIESCNNYPNDVVFTPSFADPILPQYTWVSMLSCVPRTTPDAYGNKFSLYYGMDLTITSISDFLKNKTRSIYGARGFFIETKSSYLIAVDSDIPTSKSLSDGTIQRFTIYTIDDKEVVMFSQTILSSIGSLTTLTCNSLNIISDSSHYILSYRLCTDTHIDWVLVYVVPQWNYISSTIIAVIIAMIGSILIICIGIIVATFVSLKIVKPFYKSGFSEVKQLQKQFIFMVNRIKLYKSFIPSHLLSEIENNSAENLPMMVRDDKTASLAEESTQVGEEQSSITGSRFSHDDSHRQSFKKIKRRMENINRFALYLETKSVTLLMTKLRGLNEWVEHLLPSETVILLTDVFDIMNGISRLARGAHLSLFENDSIMLSFNAVGQEESNHQEKALNASRMLVEKLSNVKSTKWRNHQLLSKRPKLADALKFNFAITTQESVCGNIGTKDSKYFTIMGSGKNNLENMLHSSSSLDVQIVCSDNVKLVCENSFMMRLLFPFTFLNDSSLSNRQDESITRNGYVYQVGSALATSNDDEWM